MSLLTICIATQKCTLTVQDVYKIFQYIAPPPPPPTLYCIETGVCRIALNFRWSLISRISRIFNCLRKYFNENFWYAACGVRVQVDLFQRNLQKSLFAKIYTLENLALYGMSNIILCLLTYQLLSFSTWSSNWCYLRDCVWDFHWTSMESTK